MTSDTFTSVGGSVQGIMPDWEDVQNSWGGRWLVSNDRGGLFTREQIDDQWLEVLFILIGMNMNLLAANLSYDCI